MIAPSTTKPKKAGSSGQSSGTHQSDMIRFVLDVLRRWWRVVLPCGLVLATIAIGLTYATFEPQFEASTLLWIDQEEPYLVHKDWSGDRNFVRNQLGLIESPLVLAPIASQPDIAALPAIAEQPGPVDVLRRMLTVENAFGSEHYFVICRSSDANTAARIVNAVTDRYLMLAEQNQSERTNQLIDLLELERESSEREVELLRENVRQMTIDQTGKDPFAANPDSDSPYPASLLESQLTAARVEQSVLSAQIVALKESYERMPIEVTDLMVEQYLQQQGQSAVRLDRRRSAKRDLQLILARERTQKLAELENQVVSNRVREQVLKTAYDHELDEAREVSGETMQLDVKRQQLARANFVLDQIAERSFLLRTEQRAPARVELVETASVPLRPIEEVPLKQMTAAGVAAMLFPFMVACLWEYRAQRIGNSEQIEKQSELSVIGEIASFPRGRRSPTISRRLKQKLRPFEESVDSFRSLLLLTDQLPETQVLAVTSAASGEGKTTIATQLAVSIARATDEPTLLVDGDMRSPQVHEVFGIPNEVGLTDLLDGQSLQSGAIQTNVFAGLHVLTAGRLHKNPHQLLRIGCLEALLREARQDYQYIVMDSPPVLVAGEALAMAKAADATIVCAMRDVSRHFQVHLAHSRLTAAGANVIGCVLSGVSPGRYGYSYDATHHEQTAGV